MLENLDYNRILAMLPVGLIGFMLTMELEKGFYADPPKNKLGVHMIALAALYRHWCIADSVKQFITAEVALPETAQLP